MIAPWIAILTTLGACAGSIEWARMLPTDTTPADAYGICGRGDWMLWLLGAMHCRGAVTRQTLVLAACAAARTALPYLEGWSSRDACVAALDTTERWCRGEATIDEVIAARRAASRAHGDASREYRRKHAASHAAADSADDAASAAAAAADAADADAPDDAADAAYAYAATYADDAADAAPDDAATYADADARQKRRAEIADAVRVAVPWPVIADALARIDAQRAREVL